MKNIRATRIFCMVLAALMLSLILIPAGSVAIGVEVGDWAKYKIEAELPEGHPMEEMEETEWVKLEVKSVVDTAVTLEVTIHHNDGTERRQTLDETQSIGFIVEADLGEGDEVIVPLTGPEGTGLPMYINGTVSRTYAGASREVNYVDITAPEASVKDYWDKATGFLCELSISTSVPEELSLSFEMTETNMWEAEAAIGVEEGDWAKYKIEAEIPVEMGEEMEMMEEMEWAKLEVKNVVGTTVTLEATIHFKNGTEGPVPEDESLIGFVIEADLGEGDEVTFPLAGPEGMTVKINGTVSRTYAGASREVNYVDITVPGASMKAYWDKATGFLCEASVSTSGPGAMSISFKMTETNLWGAAPLSEQWLWILVVVVIIVAAVAAGSAFLLLRRRKAPLPEVAPAPTE